ncbi:hypothetical protein E1263_12940 [Kribbella antibiotica]|uniref:Uncharacterized protein n=1 Tax=Kribbella antibiotica TaxID=190195 RepID=A0A4V2YPY3_9ACTN|nr:hypothetical protein [Kribbella antibiotica]TDD59997.1 hypothetical protein E1263_12940 [Kribbella antibiotica]
MLIFTVITTASALAALTVAVLQALTVWRARQDMHETMVVVLDVASVEGWEQVSAIGSLDREELKRRFKSLGVLATNSQGPRRKSSIHRRLISAATYAMPPVMRREWTAVIAEALHDFPPDQHDQVLKSLLFNVPTWIATHWRSQLRRSFSTGSTERARDER